MTSFPEQLKKLSNEIRFDPKRKAALRAKLVDETARDLLRLRVLDTERHTERQRSFLWSWNISSLKPMPIILIVALVVAAGGGVSLAAEQALPGDALYGVKVNVNEEVRAFFAASAESKARLELERATRRLEEAEALAARGRLSADVRKEIEANFASHAERTRARIAELETRGKAQSAAELSSNFEASLRAHEQILASVAAQADSAVRTEVSPLLIRVGTEKSAAAQARADAEVSVSSEAKANVRTAAEGKMRAAQNKLNEVRLFIERAKARLGTEATTQAEARLAAAESVFVEGSARMSAEAYAEAFARFQEAMRIAQEAQVLVEARQELEINIDLSPGASVDVDASGSASSETGTSAGGTAVGGEGETNVDLRLRLNPGH